MSNTAQTEAESVSRALVANPAAAITVQAELAQPHEPVVTEGQWIAANRKLLAKLGDEAYLRLLLDVLKGVDSATIHKAELADIVEMYSSRSTRS